MDCNDDERTADVWHTATLQRTSGTITNHQPHNDDEGTADVWHPATSQRTSGTITNHQPHNDDEGRADVWHPATSQRTSGTITNHQPHNDDEGTAGVWHPATSQRTSGTITNHQPNTDRNPADQRAGPFNGSIVSHKPMTYYITWAKYFTKTNVVTYAVLALQLYVFHCNTSIYCIFSDVLVDPLCSHQRLIMCLLPGACLLSSSVILVIVHLVGFEYQRGVVWSDSESESSAGKSPSVSCHSTTTDDEQTLV